MFLFLDPVDRLGAIMRNELNVQFSASLFIG
jgi:hypothetical protein